MDGIQILLYIVVALIYFIVKGMNKVVKPPEGETPPSETTPAPPQTNLPPRKTGPTSFEDLLNEFGEATRKKEKQGQDKKAEADLARQKAEQRLDKTRKKVSQRMGQAAEKAYEAKEKARQKLEAAERNQPFSYEQIPQEEYVPVYSNEASMVDYEIPEKANYAGLDDHKKRFAPFDQQAEQTKATIYARLLKDPQNVKTAFILSEILKRKYE